jgi:hypothetical protein
MSQTRRTTPRLVPTADGDRERLVRALIDAARDVQRRRATQQK